MNNTEQIRKGTGRRFGSGEWEVARRVTAKADFISHTGTKSDCERWFAWRERFDSFVKAGRDFQKANAAEWNKLLEGYQSWE